MGQGVEHLHSALRPADVEDFFGSSAMLDHLDVGDIIVDAHLAPRPGPELFALHI